jgi:cellobiose-specific phosphotransferase system component IIC
MFISLFPFFFLFAVTAAVVANPFPQNMILQAIRNYMYYVMPVILVGQAALFLYYGIRLIRLLTTFTMTEEKRSLMKRVCSVFYFSLFAFRPNPQMTSALCC